jgi:hypothetical protein
MKTDWKFLHFAFPSFKGLLTACIKRNETHTNKMHLIITVGEILLNQAVFPEEL